MKIIFFYYNTLDPLCDLLREFCNEHDIECEMINVDEDPDVLDDYNVKGVPPIFLIFDDLGHRILTHKGRFDKSKLEKIFKDISS